MQLASVSKLLTCSDGVILLLAFTGVVWFFLTGGYAILYFHGNRDRSGVAMDWKTMLSYISGSVDEELLLRNEYLVAEESSSSKSAPGSLASDRWRTAVSGRARKASG